MPEIDPRIDDYIEKSADFAKPILNHLRRLVHKACPDVVEAWKWSFPCFEYKGMLCNMAAFKKHCAFGFWKQSLLESDALPKEKTAMGSFGKITSVSDLPSNKVMTALIHKAMELNDKGVKVQRATPEKKDLVIPEVFAEALAKYEKAAEAFDKFPPGAKREYADWIADAKTEATRDKRTATAIEWIAEGKRKNWKYEKC